MTPQTKPGGRIERRNRDVDARRLDLRRAEGRWGGGRDDAAATVAIDQSNARWSFTARGEKRAVTSPRTPEYRPVPPTIATCEVRAYAPTVPRMAIWPEQVGGDCGGGEPGGIDTANVRDRRRRWHARLTDGDPDPAVAPAAGGEPGECGDRRNHRDEADREERHGQVLQWRLDRILRPVEAGRLQGAGNGERHTADGSSEGGSARRPSRPTSRGSLRSSGSATAYKPSSSVTRTASSNPAAQAPERDPTLARLSTSGAIGRGRQRPLRVGC